MSNTFPFDIHEHEKTILRWILSCEKTEQVFMCRDAIDFFICERFKFSPQSNEINIVSGRLMDALSKKEIVVNGAGMSVLD